MNFVIITGMSGAGKSRALSFFEDFGYYCVDNMPVSLIPSFLELASKSEERYKNVAIVTDVRAGADVENVLPILDKMPGESISYKIIYLEANEQTIVNRYKETRRKHPLAEDGSELSHAIKQEREILKSLRDRATNIVDTSMMSVAKLRKYIVSMLADAGNQFPIVISVMSFGFKYSVPKESDLVFDVRFLPNPYYDMQLRPKTGLDKEVKDYAFKNGQAEVFLSKLEDLLEFLLPCYISEGKNTLVVAIGCTGGKHRSVAIAEEISVYLKEKGYFVISNHRDIGKG